MLKYTAMNFSSGDSSGDIDARLAHVPELQVSMVIGSV